MLSAFHRDMARLTLGAADHLLLNWTIEALWLFSSCLRREEVVASQRALIAKLLWVYRISTGKVFPRRLR